MQPENDFMADEVPLLDHSHDFMLIVVVRVIN